jgi:hypothetical protein
MINKKEKKEGGSSCSDWNGSMNWGVAKTTILNQQLIA